MRSYMLLSTVVLLTVADAFIFGNKRTRQSAQEAVDEACIAKAQAGDCEFYTCFDRRHPCIEHNWALSYGWRFCTRFATHYDKFTPEAQRWIQGSENCTMRAMLVYYRREHIICEDLEDDMKTDHSQCEEDHGVCSADMLIENKQALMDVYKISRRTTYRFLRFMEQCSGEGVEAVLDWANSQLSRVNPLVQKFKRLFD